ncbi:MAG: hypothetical protein ACREBR_01920 [bacterium]
MFKFSDVELLRFITAYFDAPNNQIRRDGISQTESTVYDLGSAFNGTEAYWKGEARTDRLEDTMTRNQLLFVRSLK